MDGSIESLLKLSDSPLASYGYTIKSIKLNGLHIHSYVITDIIITIMAIAIAVNNYFYYSSIVLVLFVS